MNFLKLIHNIEIETLNLEQLHPAELALYFVLKKEYLKAIEILMKLKNKNKKTDANSVLLFRSSKNGPGYNNRIKKSYSLKMVITFFAQYATKAYNDCKELLKCGGVK